jgi:hypothetical protein
MSLPTFLSLPAGAYVIQEEQLRGLSPELKKLLANPNAERAG